MSEDEFEQLWGEWHRALSAAADANDDAEVLRIVDAWIARWRGVEPIPYASSVVAFASFAVPWAEPAERALSYAHEAAALAERGEDPNVRHVVGWVVKSYADVTEVTDRVEDTRTAAEAARRFARRVVPKNPKVDAQLARALRNLAVDEDSLDTRLSIVDELRQLSTRHAEAVQDTDEHLAAALVCLSRSVGRGTDEHMKLVDELASLHRRWPTSVEIAGAYVGETWNAYSTGGLEAEPQQLLAGFESIRNSLSQSDESIDQALAYLRAELEEQ